MRMILTKGKLKRVIDISNSSLNEVESYANDMVSKGWEVVIGGVR